MRYVSLFVLLFVTSNVMAQIIEDKEPAILEVRFTLLKGCGQIHFYKRTLSFMRNSTGK